MIARGEGANTGASNVSDNAASPADTAAAIISATMSLRMKALCEAHEVSRWCVKRGLDDSKGDTRMLAYCCRAVVMRVTRVTPSALLVDDGDDGDAWTSMSAWYTRASAIM